MSPKKQVMSCALIIFFLFSIASGCMLFQKPSFTMHSTTVIDDDGFPSLSLLFSANDVFTIKLIDSNGKKIFTDDLYSKAHEFLIPLATYRSNPQPGVYQLEVFDKNNNLVFEDMFWFNQSTFSIDSAMFYWWSDNSEYSEFSLIGATLTVTNNGDLPLYPYTLELFIDDNLISSDIISTVILPRETRSINCSFYLKSIKTGKKHIIISLRDIDGEFLADSIFTVSPQENVSTLQYNWNFNGEKELIIPRPHFLYDYYSMLERLDTHDYAAYVFDPYDDSYLEIIVDTLLSIVGKEDNISKINLVGSFIQSLEYEEDDPEDPTCEYPLYPVEMLNNLPGDCEDKAILAGNILSLMGYNVSLFSLPNHMAVGVHLDQDLLEYDYYIDKYYYLESIKENSVLGYVPRAYRNITDVEVYPLTTHLYSPEIISHFQTY